MLHALAAVAALLAAFPLPRAVRAQPPSGCTAAEHRQFDFWIGDWDVTTPDGKPAGTNRIERIAGGCALLENWVGAKGYVGTSINFWSPEDRKWHQTWAGSGGSFLFLEGEFREGAMTLSGATRDTSGAVTRERITWKQQSDGSVRQHWQQSVDDGKTWTDAFVGIYRRKKS
jgi:hypothetical protein